MSTVDKNDIQQLVAAGREGLAKGRLPAGLVANAELHKLEAQRVFGRCWQFLAHETEIPPGRGGLRGPISGWRFDHRCPRRRRRSARHGELVSAPRNNAVPHGDGQHFALPLPPITAGPTAIPELWRVYPHKKKRSMGGSRWTRTSGVLPRFRASRTTAE